MKRFIYKVLLFGFPVLLLLLFGISSFTIKWQGDYMLTLVDKFERLKTEKSPKIVFVGGSNLAFGMDSERVSEYYNMPVVNLGLHAGTGLRFLLEGIKPCVNKDDIIIIVPEYEHFYNIYLGTSSTMIQVLSNFYPKGFQWVSFRQLLMLFSDFPRYSLDNLYDAYIKGRAFQHREQGIYARKSFNCYGDNTAHWNESSHIRYKFEERKVRKIDRRMWKELEKYILFYQSRGVEVVILPPAIVHTMAQSMKVNIQQVTEKIAHHKNRAYQYFRPDRYALPDSLGYDTRYHFLKPGIDIRVHYFIEDLDLFLKENQVVK